MFKDIAEIKKYFSGVQKNMTDKTIMPFVDQAAIKYIIPAVGQAFYEEVKAAYLANSADPKMLLAIENLLRPLAYYTFLDALPFLSMAIGDLGAHETNTGNSMPVRQWVYNNLESACASTADIFLDHLLAMLEAKAVDYPTFRQSENYTISHELFFTSAAELTRYVNIGQSRRAFQVLRTYIRRAEDMYLQPLLGSDLFEDLKAKHLAKSLSADEKKLLEKMLKCLAQYALYEATTEAGTLIAGFQIVGGGIRVINDSDGGRQRAAVSTDLVSALKTNAMSMAKMYQNDLKKFLDDHAATFVKYQSSEFYTDKTISKTYELRDNSDSQSFRV